jgi:hypothetical protein
MYSKPTTIVLILGVLTLPAIAQLHVTNPELERTRTITTSQPAIPLTGSASAGTIRIRWDSNRGFGDFAELRGSSDATIAWTIASIPLRPGLNQIHIKAFHKSGSAEETYVNIRYGAGGEPAESGKAGTMLYRGRVLDYRIVNGLALYQGDIVLGKAPRSSTIAPTPLATTGLWPIVDGVGRVPYTISAEDQNVPTALANINSAISEFNSQLSGVIQFVPATASDVNLAEFDLTPGDYNGVCEASEGMVGGGPQILGGAINCTVGTLLHEMGHTIGLWHEQSRTDRNNFVNFLYNNVDKPNASNFDQLTLDEVDSGLYNYASIMQYPAFEFTRDGVSPTLESIPPGIPFGNTLSAYSTGDLDGIKRLYSQAPTSVTIDTNPTGLAVLVDSVQYTAPTTFSWSTGTQHTLSVPVDSNDQTLQTLSGQNYIFGRWNLPPAISPPISQTITVAAGSGSALNPTTSPAVTAYLGSFIPVHIYGPNAYPSGSFTPTPAPGTLIIGGVSTTYYQDRQEITLQANGPGGYTFYDWFTPNATLPNYYANPITFYDVTDLNDLQAVFVQDPVTSITAVSPDLAIGSDPGFAVQVDPGTSNAQTAYAPRNFVDTYDGSTWAAGQTHQLCGTFLVGNACPSSSLPTESPVTTNITYAFNDWTGFSPSSSNLLPITVASSGERTFTANYTPSFRSIVLPAPDCGGNSPATDTFFTYGTQQSFTATAGTGYSFVGWTQDFSGLTNPYTLTITSQLLGTANFNSTGTSAPLVVSSFSPASTAVSTSGLNVTVTGTGFTTNPAITSAYYNGAFRTSTLISSTQLTIELQAGDLATAGYYPIDVTNVGSTGCYVYSTVDFAVTTLPGGPNLTVAKSHTGNFTQGQQGAQYTILVTNTGAGATDGNAVTVTDFVPSGLTLTSMAGSGWTCQSGTNTCTRSDALNPGLSYPAITATVNVAANAISPQINLVNVTGGGSVQANNGDLTTITTNSGPASITATGGTPQTATVNNAFAKPLAATVTNGSGQPVSGVVVTFAAPTSGASGSFAGGVNTATTNSSGVATSASFKANTVAGAYTVTATVSGVSTAANFTLTNKAGKAASLTATGGTPQTAAIKTAFTSPLQATLKDSFGNPISGAKVTFTAPASGASGTFAGGTKTAVTNASGVATSKTFTANSIAGSYSVTGSVSGLTETASFALTNAVGKPASITATGGTPQSAAIKTAFAEPLQATVKDAGGNPVSGVVVTFKPPTSGAGGTFAGNVKTATTNASGVATSVTFTANSTTGSYTVTASYQGAKTPASFSLTNTQ